MKESSTSDSSKTNPGANSEADSRTDWEHFDALTNQQIDTSNTPPLTEDFFAKARWLMPGEGLPRQTVKVEQTAA